MTLDNVDKLRFHSRELIREFGFLNDCSQWDDLSYSQIHSLLECERYGVIEQSVLANNLRVNKPSANKLIKSLITLGYVKYVTCEENKKKKPISLTQSGLDKVKEINDEARNHVFTALKYMTPVEQLKAKEGLKIYSSALKKARKFEGIIIRPIEQEDNEKLSVLIKSVLSEFGANKPGFAYTDKETNSMYEHYQEKGKVYYVAQKGDRLLGGIGLAPLEGASSKICELRKMYLTKETRGIGLGFELLRMAIDEGKKSYKSMYLETLSRMSQAISLYQSVGFKILPGPLGNTGHYNCDTWMIKELI